MKIIYFTHATGSAYLKFNGDSLALIKRKISALFGEVRVTRIEPC